MIRCSRPVHRSLVVMTNNNHGNATLASYLIILLLAYYNHQLLLLPPIISLLLIIIIIIKSSVDIDNNYFHFGLGGLFGSYMGLTSVFLGLSHFGRQQAKRSYLVSFESLLGLVLRETKTRPRKKTQTRPSRPQLDPKETHSRPKRDLFATNSDNNNYCHNVILLPLVTNRSRLGLE
jgi:hypothetical protein